MSTAADRVRAKAGRLSSSQRPRPEDEPATAVVPPRAERVKPVRMTLDLAPALHADFDDWTSAAARKIGQSRVNRADVLRVLVRRLLDDEDLQDEVLEALRAGK